MSTPSSLGADFESLLSPAVRTTSVDDVVAKLREILLSGGVAAGEKLPSERELARLLQVSRTTLREALRKLEAHGLITVRLGGSGGAFFSPPDPGLMGSALAMLLSFESVSEEDLTDYRIDFERENAELAARRATDEELAGLQKILEEVRNLKGSDWTRVREIDLAVHELLPTLSHNAVRVAISAGIHDALARSFAQVEPSASSPDLLRDEVIDLLTKVIARDGDGARAAMAEHLRRWRS
ncbi:FadR/GntR family transcriptional regulator [Rhodococcus wratislaviensis]|uniref:Putative GntR family transcriptional regulator n=1 Tax=Rhodococcus wratislaviensis NBRC 100605 TaxID=1219028 RepID=X0Q2H3_RHOWR|nr:GntR family transcriptional regulator [Rhodococcus wratislaviensis]GAF50308.1 putative GntR family transcriptional regulator [Rhodococcus wratislaviensis NBRC 100605]